MGSEKGVLIVLKSPFVAILFYFHHFFPHFTDFLLVCFTFAKTEISGALYFCPPQTTLINVILSLESHKL